MDGCSKFSGKVKNKNGSLHLSVYFLHIIFEVGFLMILVSKRNSQMTLESVQLMCTLDLSLKFKFCYLSFSSFSDISEQV